MKHHQNLKSLLNTDLGQNPTCSGPTGPCSSVCTFYTTLHGSIWRSGWFWFLDGAAGSARPAAAPRPQLVPQFDERFPVLPDQLVSKQDVPSEERRAVTTLPPSGQNGNYSSSRVWFLGFIGWIELVWFLSGSDLGEIRNTQKSISKASNMSLRVGSVSDGAEPGGTGRVPNLGRSYRSTFFIWNVYLGIYPPNCIDRKANQN